MIFLGRGVLREHWSVVSGYRMYARVAERERPADLPPVILVHGLGVSSRYMTPLAAKLAPTFHVYAPDLPGFGRSDKPKRALSVSELGATLSRWLQQAGIKRGLVAGNSMGCQIMVELAHHWPGFICGAVLLGPTMDTTVPHSAGHVWRLFQDQFFEPPALVALQAFDYVTNGPIRTVDTFREALRHDMLGRVHLIGAPAVLMRGEHDPIASRAWIQQLAIRLPGARMIEVPGAGHALNYNSPGRVAKVIRELAARVCQDQALQR
ncbi:MAG TPA: alpha/beta hydrolase [Bryobacteraceae bacterium]|nr:alpha/beta hydrolase [Bryobacteraceae bacterium]